MTRSTAAKRLDAREEGAARKEVPSWAHKLKEALEQGPPRQPAPPEPVNPEGAERSAADSSAGAA
jgi:hypothetical protein